MTDLQKRESIKKGLAIVLGLTSGIAGGMTTSGLGIPASSILKQGETSITIPAGQHVGSAIVAASNLGIVTTMRQMTAINSFFGGNLGEKPVIQAQLTPLLNGALLLQGHRTLVDITINPTPAFTLQDPVTFGFEWDGATLLTLANGGVINNYGSLMTIIVEWVLVRK